MKSFIFSWTLLILYAGAMDIESHPNWSLLKYENCGNSNADRIVGGKNASLGAYPWLARIAYRNISRVVVAHQMVYKCGGTLISQLHVLTAAHCVTNLPRSLQLEGVRLGEYNLDTDPDCDEDFCADPVQDFTLGRVIYHERYNVPQWANDIALIRLSRPALLNEFVLPICMPRGPLLKKNFVGELAEVAGWGISDIVVCAELMTCDSILQTVTMPIRVLDICKHVYDHLVPVGEGHLCAGGRKGEDSCAGDSGGPLMKVESLDGPPRYYIIGLVSFGAKRCGASEEPGVYTEIAHYLRWILNNLSS